MCQKKNKNEFLTCNLLSTFSSFLARFVVVTKDPFSTVATVLIDEADDLRDN